MANRKWLVVYGEYKNQEKRALDVITSKMSEYTKYVVTAKRADALTDEDSEKYCLVLLGTADNNKYINELCVRGEITIPDNAEGYTVKVTEPDADGKQLAVVAGGGAGGVMYGACEFAYRYIGTLALMTGEYSYSDAGFFELGLDRKARSFEVSTSPAVRERGLWTWGHVIYDYRRYFEHMADLRMNVAVIWNDFAPINAKEIVEYAHSLGIKVIWGYSWGWNSRRTDKIDLSDEGLRRWSDSIIKIYEEQYADTGADGIYFQSFTELESDKKDGMLIADAVTQFVNGIVKNFYARYPDLRIQFGVHCESVREHIEYLAKVDPRVEIIWENCGSFPYWYNVNTDDFEATNAFTEKLATLRGEDDRFGVVIKEMTKLDWSTFKHIEGPYVMGEATDEYIKWRVGQTERRWRQMQSGWIENADQLLKNVRIMKDAKGGDLCAVALVEDGLFERNAYLPVALYASALWNPDRDEKELLTEVAHWSNVKFAN